MRAIALLFLPLACALFEDQAGSIDWFRSNIGRVTGTVFHSSGQQRVAVVSTEQGVLAGIDLRSGSTLWRQVLPDGESIVSLLQQGRLIVTLGQSSRGAVVRLWSPQGELAWDALLPSCGSSSPAPVGVLTESGVLVGCSNTVVSYHGGSGTEIWAHRWAESAKVVQLVHSGAEVHAYALTGDATTGDKLPMARVVLNAADGTLQGSPAQLTAGGVLPADTAVVATLEGGYVGAFDATKCVMHVHTVGASDSVMSSPIDLAKLMGEPCGAGTQLLPLSLPRMLAISPRAGVTALLSVTGAPAAPSATLFRLVRDGGHVFAHATARDGKALLALTSANSLEVIQLAPDGTHGAWEALAPPPLPVAQHGALAAVWLNSYSRKDGAMGHRLLVRTQDDALHLMQAGPIATADGAGGPTSMAAWTREEALAAVLETEMIPLPLLASEAAPGDCAANNTAAARPSFAFALPALLSGLRRRAEDALAGPAPAVPSATLSAEAAARLHGDSYGTRQVLLLRTGASKVFGLHSSTGAIIWSHFVPPLASGESPPKLLALHTSRVGGVPQVIIVAQGATAYSVLTLHPFSGALLTSHSAAGTLRLTTRLPSATEVGLLLVDATGRAFVHPDTAAARAELDERASEVFFHAVTGSEEQLEGFGLSRVSGRWQATQRWAVTLPRGVRSTSTFPFEAAVHSPVRTKGDRSVLHKYVNRNLLAVGVAVEAEQVSVSGAPTRDQSVQILLIDSVSGRVLHTARHTGCAGPVRLLMGEHWLLYKYYSPQQQQHLLTASEFYMNSSIADDVLSLVLAGRIDYEERENMFDAFTAPPPHVEAQTYALPTAVAAMGLTHTAAGITPKQVLFATDAGQLLALEKRLFDPRRPLVPMNKLSAADREEGLIPYAPSIGGVNPLTAISHTHTLARPTAVLTAPTMLESTSLVFTAGLDLFFTRVSPARAFDRLNDDFNYVALVGATAFLTIATFGSGWYAKRRDLVKMWK